MLNNLLGGLFTTLSKQASTIIDETITTKEEKWKLKNEFHKILMDSERNAQQEVTKRWEADSKAGWLPANIRPLTLIFLTVMFVIISMFDGNVGNFTIDDAYKPIYQTLLICCYSAYFAGRSIEKIKKK